MPKFVFETKTRVVVHADTLDQAWNELPEAAQLALPDMDWDEVPRRICPHCDETFDINDKDSEHQVNDALGGVTFCSMDCSQEHTFCAEGFPLLVETHKNSSLLEIKQSIHDEIIDDLEKEFFLENLAQSVYDAVQTKEETL